MIEPGTSFSEVIQENFSLQSYEEIKAKFLEGPTWVFQGMILTLQGDLESLELLLFPLVLSQCWKSEGCIGIVQESLQWEV